MEDDKNNNLCHAWKALDDYFYISMCVKIFSNFEEGNEKSLCLRKSLELSLSLWYLSEDITRHIRGRDLRSQMAKTATKSHKLISHLNE